jgi:hypothetical protein
MTTIPPSTSGWTLENINSKVRAITGMPSTDQMTDAQVNAYINNYLLYVMPHELKVQIANQNILFTTTPGVNTYVFPASFVTDSPGAYADGFPLIFYEDPDIFYQDWPIQYAVENVAAGGLAIYGGTVQNPPIIVGTFFITDGIQVEQDKLVVPPVGYPVGKLYDQTTHAVTGTINYVTGVFTVTFPVVTSALNTIYTKYQSYSPNRPQGILFYNNQFTFMPVPDQAYQIQLQGFIQPLQLGAGSIPLQQEWGPLIAFGAAVDIFGDRGDTDNINKYEPMLKRYENIALGRTVQQFTPMQGVPRF